MCKSGRYIETKILSDLDEKLREITIMGIEQPEVIRVVSKVESDWSSEVAYSYHILFTFANVFHMRKRKVRMCFICGRERC
jgi:hypothetical protein